MCNLEELKKCRIIRRKNSVYLVTDNGEKWVSIENGITYMVDEYHYDTLECAYKTFDDFLNGVSYYYRNEKSFLSMGAKQWIKNIVRSLKDVDYETLELEVCDDYCSINFKTNRGYYNEIVLPNYDNIIYDFTKLEKDEKYTFKELGIKL